ncbi:PREDICTED: uncharacterized protein LOC109146944 [Ipomoea nil]|uniref:uncharacterized protein LOC109146944 n=1 Tax=Ipomoea nil TaxID=35883 RepID=UPI0009015D97|nr:PREDICTED: uncharacterized protein LOC109146944 [Ipomoea nil]
MVVFESHAGDVHHPDFGPKTFECVVGEVGAMLESSIRGLADFFAMARGTVMEAEVCRQVYGPIQPRLRELDADFRAIVGSVSLSDVPSFSLGLTQDFGFGGVYVSGPDAVTEVVNNIAAECVAVERDGGNVMDEGDGDVCAEQADVRVSDEDVVLPEGGDVGIGGVGSGLGVSPMSDCAPFSTPVEG